MPRHVQLRKITIPPKVHSTIAQFRTWQPSRQRDWIAMMNLENAKGKLSPEQIQTLARAERDFSHGL